MVRQISSTLTITIKKQDENYTIEANGSKGIKVDPQPAPQLKDLLSNQLITDTLKDLSSQTAPATTDAIQKLGKALYDSLFTDRDFLLAFGKVQGSASSDSGARLRLQIEPIELAALPWETLYDGKDWLSAQSTTPLVRKLTHSNNRKPLQKLQIRGALRILFVGASPEDLDPLKVEETADELETLLGGAIKKKQIVFDKLLNATLEDLQQGLLKDYHILYFAGHGSPEGIFLDDGQGDDIEKEGKVIGRERGDKSLVSAETLAQALKGKQTRLVFLAACETSKASEGSRLLRGFAQELAERSNLPAIVAMQYFISDMQANPLTTQFFAALAAGRPVDVAMAEARSVLMKKGQVSRDVFSPVLYLQAEDGALFPKAKNWPVVGLSVALLIAAIAVLYQAQLSSLREKAAVVTNRLSTDAPINGLVLAIDATGQNRFWLPWNMLSSVQSSLLVVLEEARESNSFTIEGQDFIETAAFSSDGKYIATGNGFTASGSPPPGMTPMKANGTIWLRDLQGNPISKPMPHKGRVDYIAFSSDGKYIASRDLEEKFVKIWNLQGNLIKKESAFNITNSRKQNIFINDKNVLFLQGNSTYGDIQALSSDSKYTASAQSLSNVITIKDNLTQENTNEPKILTNLRGCESSIKAIRFNENNTHVIAVCSDRKIKIWELQDSSVISIKINKSEQYTGGFTFDKNSQNLITGNADGIIKIWDLYGKERKYFKTLQSSISSIAVSQNGQYILINGSSLQLWDTNGNQIHEHFKADGHTIESVAFSAENKYIISGGYDGTVRLWNLEGENLKTFELAKGSFHRKEEVWSVKSIASTSDSKYIVAGISTDEFNIGGYVQLLDINGNPQGQPFGNTWQFALSPNGKYIAVGDANNTIQLWDMKGNRVSPLFRGHENWINSLAFSPDGRFIASASFNILKLWDTQGNLISTFQVHQGDTNSLMFSPDGQYIAGSSVDGTVKLWPSNWKTALKVACNRLKHHPVLTDPKTDEEKSAARTCLSYGKSPS